MHFFVLLIKPKKEKRKEKTKMRKKLFAVIMSAMMMITFMPSMAFAATPVTAKVVKWDANFDSVEVQLLSGTTVVDTVTAPAVKSWHASDDGSIAATASFANWTDLYTVSNTVAARYYNLTDAKLSNSNGIVAGQMTGDEYLYYNSFINQTTGAYTSNPLGNYIRFAKPAKETNWAASQATHKMISLDNDNLKSNLIITVKPSTYTAYDADGDYSFPVSIVRKNSNINAAKVIGSAPTEQKVKIVFGETSTLSYVPFKAVGAPKGGVLTGDVTSGYNTTLPYAGAQNFEIALKGIKAEYQWYDAKAGDYTAWSTTAPEMKNADTYNFLVRFTREGKTTYLNGETGTPVTVVVEAVPCFVDFTNYNMTFHEGQEFTKADMVALFMDVVPTYTTQAKKINLTGEDLATWNKIVEKYVNVEGIANLVGEYTVYGSYANTLAAADTDEAIKAFLTNYQIDMSDTFDVYSYNGQANLKIAEGKNDVTAINQTKTFHVKKAKALKAKKTFKLSKDVADWGTISYIKLSGNSKISVAKDGKVTVKKGLKKGKYTVKIKVKAPGAKATKKLTVKVVK